MSLFQHPRGGRNGIGWGFNQPGDEGPFGHTRHTKESEYHGPANVNLQARGAQRAGQDSAQLYRTEPFTTAVQLKGSYMRREPQQRSVGPPPGFPLPGLACASQPAPSTNTPAEHVTQHASRSTAMALMMALGSDTTKTTAPALAAITPSASAENSSNGVVRKQQAMASNASSSSPSTPHSPPTLPQPSLSISREGMPRAGAAGLASVEPVSASASALRSSYVDEESASAHSCATSSQMPQSDGRKTQRPSRSRRRPPPGVRKQMAAEAAEFLLLAAAAEAYMGAAAAAADAAQAAAD